MWLVWGQISLTNLEQYAKKICEQVWQHVYVSKLKTSAVEYH